MRLHDAESELAGHVGRGPALRPSRTNANRKQRAGWCSLILEQNRKAVRSFMRKVETLVDRLTQKRRSWLMSRVKSKNTSPEVRVRQVAHALGLRFRLHRKNLPGRPDLVFPKHKVAILVHGCFWHRHRGCSKASMPKSRIEYWQKKFDTNVARDTETEKELLRLGWRVLIVWECMTREPTALIELLRQRFHFE